ncbi:MAG: hypothetical protein IKP40_00665 [Clostridia bacterium]|nr:hypothetical protein [Clostridia bacterium]
MFECIDFDSRFADYTTAWMKKHLKEYRNYDAMEADIPRVYLSFLNEPAPWLDGLTPGSFFSQYEDPKDLVDWLRAYCEQDVPVPEILLEQIESVGKPCEKRLLALLQDETAPMDARTTAVGVLKDMDSVLPRNLYITWQLNRGEDDELAEIALDALDEMGQAAVPQMLEALGRANEAGQEALLDVLVRHSRHKKLLETALRLFETRPARRAVFAGHLARLGDEAALPALMKAANDPATGYADFIELRAAIEALGGTPPDRDFSGDPQFEALQKLQ